MAAGQQGRVEAWSETDSRSVRQATARVRRDGEATGRQAALDNPAFISDEAEEQHYLDTIADEAAVSATRATARMELARLYERRGQFSDAVELYERNLWEGIRTPATYARLAAAYRTVGRDDLAEATLEQVRRNGGARQAPANDTRAVATPALGARSARPRDRAAGPNPAIATVRRGTRVIVQSGPQVTAHLASAATAVGSTKRLAEPFLTGQAGRRTRVISTVILPIALGVVIMGILVMMSRGRTPAAPPVPTSAPVATVAPTAVPTPAIAAALTQPPASARLLVANVGAEGLSLRKAPGNGERIKVWKEGTELLDLGQKSEQGGKTWRQVRDPDGSVGWAASDFLSDPAAPVAATAAGARPENAGRPTPAAPPFASGGLGLSRQEWEQGHGQPSRTSIFLEYDGGRLIVGLPNENVGHLERVWTPQSAVALDAARSEARAFLPADATLIQSIERGDGRTVDVYASASLASRFGPNAWNGGKTGTFSIQYRHRSAEDRRVTSAMFRLGDVAF